METTATLSSSTGQAAAPAVGAIVVMGVSGCGKSTIGQLLAHRLGWRFIEGDTFHSASNRSKMQAGIALDDSDRSGWLDVLGAELARHAGTGVVLSCSALKRAYREQLRAFVPDLRFVWLDLTRAAAEARVATRAAHFFPATLIDSQFHALEPPNEEAGLFRADGQGAPQDIADATANWLRQAA